MNTREALETLRAYSAQFADPEDYAHARTVVDAAVFELRLIDGALGYDDAWAGMDLHNAVDILRQQRDDARNALRALVAMDDAMNDPGYEERGTYQGAYYCYYAGQQNRDAWDAARKALAGHEWANETP